MEHKFSQGYALIIGIASYPETRKLPISVLKDATDLFNLLADPARGGYQARQIRLLLDHQATQQALRDELDWLASVAGPDDTALFFYSGHGGRAQAQRASQNFLIPYDCHPSDLPLTAISGDELHQRLARIPARRLLALFDCCYAGGLQGVKDLQPEPFESGLPESYYEQLAQGSGRVMIASSRADEVSQVLPGMSNSLFTPTRLAAMQGAARTRGDGLVRVFDVFEHISEQVPARASQHPIFKASDLENNFPIALLPEEPPTQPVQRSNLPAGAAVDKRLLRTRLNQAFSLEELELLCADVQQALADQGVELQVSLEITGGVSKEAKILNLIAYLDRRGQLAALAAAAQLARPGLI
jgi:hypothetical protein